MPIYVVTLEGKEPPDPAQLTVLAFVEAADDTGAESQALAALAERNWAGVAALRCGEVTDEGAVPADFANAMASARRYGLGLIIYESP